MTCNLPSHNKHDYSNLFHISYMVSKLLLLKEFKIQSPPPSNSLYNHFFFIMTEESSNTRSVTITQESLTSSTDSILSSLVIINVAQLPLKLEPTTYPSWKAQLHALLFGYSCLASSTAPSATLWMKFSNMQSQYQILIVLFGNGKTNFFCMPFFPLLTNKLLPLFHPHKRRLKHELGWLDFMQIYPPHGFGS